MLQEQEKEQQEIDKLEAEVRKKAAEQEMLRLEREAAEAKFKAQQEEEYASLQRTLGEKKRKLQHLETVKDLKAAQARLQVYDQTSITEEQKVDVAKINTEDKDNKHVSFPPHKQVVFQAVSSPPSDSATDLVKVLASALSANRIPVPEPAVFSGDPLRYSDWKLSFQTLIDQKNIPENEKIFYLRRYVSGQAKSALDGYFLLGTESAYVAAWKTPRREVRTSIYYCKGLQRQATRMAQNDI